jgi:hypothetical protein
MKSLPAITTALLLLFAFLSCAPPSTESGALSSIENASPPSIESSAPSSIEDAKRFAVGVWTDADRPADGSWEKWVVKSDNTIDVFEAPATADNWGAKKETITYSMATAKYDDTGKRYYALNVELIPGNSVNFILGTDGRLRKGYSDDWFVKGDRFPFSK